MAVVNTHGPMAVSLGVLKQSNCYNLADLSDLQKISEIGS
jgi:hypothetical protein